MERNDGAEQVEVLGPGPGAGESMNNLRVREMDGERLFEAEGVESMVTHLLNEWRMRTDTRNAQDAERGERLVGAIRQRAASGPSDATVLN